jgi:dipeptidase E
MRRLLLLSNSTLHGSGYLDYCEAALRRHFASASGRILFVPHALHDRDAYAAKARAFFAALGIAVDSLHDSQSISAARAAVERAQGIFIGGGNTFRLLSALYEVDVLSAIRARVAAGMPYAGASAGSNVACITIKTTNDMPIVYPPSLDALALVPFNINAHYQDPLPDSTHMGETREQRIREFHEMNEPAVVGLREGALLEIDDDHMTLRGSTGARVFRKGLPAEEFASGASLDFLLARG